MTRTALAYATVTLAITESIEPNADDPAHTPTTKIDIAQTATGGIQSFEKRTADWRVRGHEDRIFGALSGQSRLVRGQPTNGKVRPNVEVQTQSSDEEKVARFLRGEILADGSEVEGFVVDEVQDKEGVSYGEGEGLWLQSWVRNEKYKWSAEQVCFALYLLHSFWLIKYRSGALKSSTASATILAASLSPRRASISLRDWSTTTRARLQHR